MDGPGRQRAAGRRVLFGSIVVGLTATALSAVAILIAGDFGETQRRILGTTALLAAYGLLALPAGFLIDQGRLRALAGALLGLAVAGFSLAEATIWIPDAPEALAKGMATATIFAVAAAQTAALAAGSGRASTAVRRLFAVSVVLVLVVAAMVTTVVWAEIDSEVYARALAVVIVLDVLAVALQPIVALAQRGRTVYALRVTVEDDGDVATTIEASDFAAAAAKAIRSVERSGRRPVGVAAERERTAV